jgi:hypothetical protein
MSTSNSSGAAPASRGLRIGIIHRLQVQAFVDAAEEVDVEEDVLDDLLEGIEDEDEPREHEGELRLDAKESFEPEENDGLDDPEYIQLIEECTCLTFRDKLWQSLMPFSANRAWSPQEVRAMKHYLKEKGSKHLSILYF